MLKFGELVTSDVPVLIHFFAQWNEGCAAMNPVLQSVAGTVGEQLRIVKIDVEKNGELAEALRIKQVPTMLLYKGGAMIWRQSGFMNAEALINVVTTL
ncbi:thioredoxin family protein [Myroides indicus]|uniref:Thioredoxin 1 n=1 Tax=Myroides indicus TaxID=1323422 RepID=A0A4R7ERE2_9FLAO|nr:thioredoxin family protein [Myroides indicus]TDS55902.1 thioredoxin 1 [Myroides indicus]